MTCLFILPDIIVKNFYAPVTELLISISKNYIYKLHLIFETVSVERDINSLFYIQKSFTIFIFQLHVFRVYVEYWSLFSLVSNTLKPNLWKNNNIT